LPAIRKWPPGTGSQGKLRIISKRILGDECCICKSNRSLTVHRKDGFTHRAFELIGVKKFEEELMSGEYVRLCYSCHKGVHWVMKFFGWQWDTIYKLAITVVNRDAA